MEEYAADKDNIKLQFVDSGFDQTALVNGAENLINSGVDVLVITPIDAAACSGVVEMAHEAGIYVICESNRIEGVYPYFGAGSLRRLPRPYGGL